MSDHSERAHSPIGASSAKRWMNCSASVKMSEGIPNTSSKYAEEGTLAHELGEWCIANNRDPKDSYELFNQFTGKEATKEMAEAVQVYYDTVMDIVEKHQVGDEPVEVTVEERFNLPNVHPDAFGTNDCMVYIPFEKVYIIDYKHGQGVKVEAKDNEQLLYYALGALAGIEVQEVEMIIVQPRCFDNENPGGVRRWSVPVSYLKEFEKKLKKAAEAVFSPNPTLKAGEWCRFCPAAGKCPKLTEQALSVAEQGFDVIEGTEEINLPSPSSMTPEKIARVLEMSEIIANWAKEVASYAQTQAEMGVSIPHHKLVAKRANRKWKDEAIVTSELEELFGDDIYEKKLKSPAQMEKVVGKEAVAELCETPDAGLTLVHETDRRKEVKPQLLEMFEEL